MKNFESLVTIFIDDVLQPLVIVLIGLALVVFFWGLVKYLRSEGTSENREKTRSLMVWGVIALFVMVSVWGLVKMVQNTFFEEEEVSRPPTAPKFDLVVD